jgi:hypothetical protein
MTGPVEECGSALLWCPVLPLTVAQKPRMSAERVQQSTVSAALTRVVLSPENSPKGGWTSSEDSQVPSRADDNDVDRFEGVIHSAAIFEWLSQFRLRMDFLCKFDGPASEDASTPTRPGAICLDWAKRNSSTRVQKEPSKGFQRRGPRTGDGIPQFAGALKRFRPRPQSLGLQTRCCASQARESSRSMG